MFFYQIPGPNEALLITGKGAKVDNKRVVEADPSERDAPRVEETQDFKVITGKGAMVIPGLQRYSFLSLDALRVDLGDESPDHSGVLCVSKQSIPVVVEAVLIFKVGDDRASIVNAGRRFMDKTAEQICATVKEMAHGHLRTIVGGLTVEDLITDRARLTQEVRDATAADMQKLGLHIDTFQVKEIRDVAGREGAPGYIENLGKPQAAAVAAAARVAAARQEQEAAEKEQEAMAAIAEATRDSAVRQAKAQAETDRARAEQAQAGPLAEATARQAVVEANTRAAALEADLAEQKLQTAVRKPADAEAYAVATKAEGAKKAAISQAQAEAERTRVQAVAAAEARRVQAGAEAEATTKTGAANASSIEAKAMAEAHGLRERGLAEAAGIKARQEALSANSEGVVSQQIAESLPAIVEAAARQWDNVSQLTVFDGAEGLNRSLLSTIGTASSIMPLAKALIDATKGIGANGGEARKPAPAPTERKA
ncbi:MAG: SPFH domain-containing protein [Solirubrobacteraceae bacterium]